MPTPAPRTPNEDTRTRRFTDAVGSILNALTRSGQVRRSNPSDYRIANAELLTVSGVAVSTDEGDYYPATVNVYDSATRTWGNGPSVWLLERSGQSLESAKTYLGVLEGSATPKGCNNQPVYATKTAPDTGGDRIEFLTVTGDSVVGGDAITYWPCTVDTWNDGARTWTAGRAVWLMLRIGTTTLAVSDVIWPCKLVGTANPDATTTKPLYATRTPVIGPVEAFDLYDQQCVGTQLYETHIHITLPTGSTVTVTGPYTVP